MDMMIDWASVVAASVPRSESSALSVVEEPRVVAPQSVKQSLDHQVIMLVLGRPRETLGSCRRLWTVGVASAAAMVFNCTRVIGVSRLEFTEGGITSYGQGSLTCP